MTEPVTGLSSGIIPIILFAPEDNLEQDKPAQSTG